MNFLDGDVCVCVYTIINFGCGIRFTANPIVKSARDVLYIHIHESGQENNDNTQ